MTSNKTDVAMQTDRAIAANTSNEATLRAEFQALLRLDAQLLRDPHPFHRRLREQAPIFRLDDATVVVSSYDLAMTVYRDAKRFRAIEDRVMGFADRLSLLSNEDLERYQDFLSYERGWLTKINGERHRRVRTAAKRGFGRSLIDEIRPAIATLIDELLDDLADQERPDFMTVAYRLPVLVIMDIMGAPREDAGMLKDWCDAISKIGGHAGQLTSEIVADGHQAMISYHTYVRELISAQRGRSDCPRTVATLLDESEADHLDEEELAALYNLLMFAGHETTTSLLSNGLLLLLDDRKQWDMVRAEPDARVPGAIEEMLRFEAPVPFFAKQAVDDQELGGLKLDPLTTVFIDNAAANRDPSIFPDPDVFDITRAPKQNLAFGYGVHFCLGAPLARLEARLAFERLVERMPEIKLAAHVQTLEYRPNYLLRGVLQLPVRVGELR